MKQHITIIIFCLLAFSHVSGQNLNTVRNWAPVKPLLLESDVVDPARTTQEVLLTTEYIDGFGRPVQSVTRKSSPSQMDAVSFHKYDQWGRELQQFLPFVSGNDGNYKSNPEALQLSFNQTQFPGESNFYSQVDMENSPGNRVLKTYNPGSTWVGNSLGSTVRTMVNTDLDNVRIWTIDNAVRSVPVSTSYYPAGTLAKSIVTDEKNLQVIVYKDKQGQVILKKSQSTSAQDNGNGSSHLGWVCTYFVYDDWGNMRYVITPKAVALIDGSWTITSTISDELCYRYEFDQYKRVIIKKNPGTQTGMAGEVWTVYDQRGRTVMLQDGNLRGQQKWQYFQYDDQDRPVATGLMYDPVNYQNLNYHLSNALNYAVSPSYPDISLYSTELLTQSFYDNYSWTSGTGLSASMDQSNINNTAYFYTASNTVFPYPQQIKQSTISRGRLTGSRTEVLGTGGSQYLYTVNYYDDYGKVVQSQGTNITGGIDKATTQYSWTGISLRVLEEHAKNTGTTQTHKILTKMNYGSLGRLQSVTKTISSVINTSPTATVISGVEKTISTYTYNELGEVKVKTLGTDAAAAPLETQNFEYTVRGWLKGVNRNFTQSGSTTNYFGEDLGYDKSSTANGTTTFAQPMVDGNISGMVWKTKGDGIARKYDYTYDNLGQLTGAGYLQNTTSATWDKTYIDYSVSGISYDLNGNIKTLTHNGFILGGGNVVDNLSYNYMNGETSNRIMNVVDNANNPASRLGDFHYTGTKLSTATDYGYDANGNLVSDVNKNISSITYNILNLPNQVVVTSKGTITYTYDATGNKLKKVTQENNASVVQNGNNYTTDITTTTTYIAGFTYQSKTFSNPSLSALNVADALQYIAHDEGRARIVTPLYGPGPYYAYDYYVKDHLGNIRVTLTDELQQDTYPAATLEPSAVTTEQSFYNITNDANHIIPTSGLAWWPLVTGNSYNNNNNLPVPPDPTINPGGSSTKLYKLNGLSGDRFGMGIALKVMAGDKVSVFGKSVWHNNAGTTSNAYNVSGVLTSFINAFAGTSAVIGGSKGTATGTILNNNATTTGNLSNLLNNIPAPGGQTPKAGINWILFDEQFKPVESGSSFDPVNATADAVKSHVLPDISIIKSGYLYVYCSNESNQDVYFDNLQVVQNHGPLIEEAHYYPFGLSMFGLASKAYGKPKVNYGYQGKEMQNGEFYDGTGLEEYDFSARFYDPQLGRWWTQDPVTKYASPYSSMANNPAIFVDPDGKNPIVVAVIIGAIAGGYTGYKIAEAQGYNLGDIKTWGYMIGGAAIGAVSGYTGASIAAGGGFMANTFGLIFSSAYNSIGMSALSGGEIQPSVSFGAASLNLETGEFGWLGKKGNSFMENLGYTFGAMANLQDIFAGIHGTDATYRAESDGVPHARVNAPNYEGKVNGVDGSHKIDISVAHEHVDPSVYKCDGPCATGFGNVMDYAQYWATHVKGGVYYPTVVPTSFRVQLNNVNGRWLARMTERIIAKEGKFGIGKLKYGTTLWGCQSHVAQALWGVGIPTLPINFHPMVLFTQLAIRQVGIFANPYLINNQLER